MFEKRCNYRYNITIIYSISINKEDTNQNQLDEIILSLHFLPDEKGNLKMIDKCWGSFESSFRHRGKENIWQLYWETMKKMVSKKWDVKNAYPRRSFS